MYQLKLAGKAAVDLVAGDRPCKRCAYTVSEIVEVGRIEALCTRHIDQATGQPVLASEARNTSSLCGGRGWVCRSHAAHTAGGDPAAPLYSGGCVSLGAKGVECGACRFVIPPEPRIGLIEQGCARYVDDIHGTPATCAEARSAESECGGSGRGFEQKQGRTVAGDCDIVSSPSMAGDPARRIGSDAAARLDYITSIGDRADAILTDRGAD